MPTFKIFYAKNPTFRAKGIDLDKSDVLNEITHAYVKDIEVDNLNEVFFNMQGEIWSPNGEARELIVSKGLFHTSMSIGDCALNTETNELKEVDMIGWKNIE